jgi:hypothetical protein
MQDGSEYCPDCNRSTTTSPLDVRCRSHELAFVRSRLDALRRGIAWIAGGGQPLTPDTLRRLLEGDDRHEPAAAASWRDGMMLVLDELHAADGGAEAAPYLRVRRLRTELQRLRGESEDRDRVLRALARRAGGELVVDQAYLVAEGTDWSMQTDVTPDGALRLRVR